MNYPERECRIGHGGLEIDRRQLEIALDAAVEASRRQARELALADVLAQAVVRLLGARAKDDDLSPYFSALSAALDGWRNRSAVD